MFVLADDATIIGEFLIAASVVVAIVAALVLTRRPLGVGSGETLVGPSIVLLLAVSLVAVIAAGGLVHLTDAGRVPNSSAAQHKAFAVA